MLNNIPSKKMSTLNLLFLFWQVEENLETREVKIKKTMQKIIDDFVKDSSAIDFHCSADLSTYERMLLHDLAEKLQLGHVSQGDGKKRHIVLSKGARGLKKVEVDDEGAGEKKDAIAAGHSGTFDEFYYCLKFTYDKKKIVKSRQCNIEDKRTSFI